MKTSFRLLAPAALLLALLAAILWQPSAARAVNYSFSGSLDASDPFFNRPLTLTSLSSVGTNVHYDVQGFILTLADSVTLSVTSATFTPGTADDSFLLLYQGSFNPASPLTNLIALDDDSGPGSLSLFTTTLSAATNYFLVTTSFSNNVTGAYSDTIAPATALNVVVPITVPEPSTYAMMAGGLGVLVLLQRRRSARRTA